MGSKGEVGALNQSGGCMGVVSRNRLWQDGKSSPAIFFLMWGTALGSTFGMIIGVALGY